MPAKPHTVIGQYRKGWESIAGSYSVLIMRDAKVVAGFVEHRWTVLPGLREHWQTVHRLPAFATIVCSLGRYQQAVVMLSERTCTVAAPTPKWRSVSRETWYGTMFVTV